MAIENLTKKATIFGIGNSGDFNYIIIQKHKGMNAWLSYFLKEAFGEHYPTAIYTFEKGKHDYKKRKAENLKDYHETLTRSHKHINKKVKRPRIDIFYGDKTIFITLICNKRKRKKFTEVLEKISRFHMPKKNF